MPRTILRCLWLAATAAGAAAIGTGFSGPETAAIGMVAGGMAGNLSTDFFKILDQRVAGRFFDGHSGIDENHHVSIALRLAHLNALRTVFDRFDQLMKNEPDAELRHSAERFSHGLDNFLTVDTKATEKGDLTGGPIRTSDENLIRQAVLRDLPKAFDQGLATRRAAGDHPAILESLKQIREAAEAAVLAEICLRTSVLPEHVPRLFRSAFDGSRFSDGWFDLFIRDAAFRLKDSADFERIWNAEQIALIKAITDAHTAVLDEINARTDRIEQDQRTHIARTEQGQTEQKEMLQELLTIARGGGVFQRAAEQGISEAAVRAIVERLGGEKIGHDDLLPWLDNWIEAARQQLGRHGNEGAAFEAARREADRRFKAGHLREASSAFMDELAREERLETYRQTERKHVRIKLLEEAVSFDELALTERPPLKSCA